MFDKFGEFNNAAEINRAAEAQKAEGDLEAVKLLAKENGIDAEDVKDYLDGVVEELCTPLTAALGKIEVESEMLGLFGVFQSWKEMLIDEAIKNKDLQENIRKKGKSLKDAMASVLKAESKGRKAIPEEIAKAAGIPKNTQVSTMTAKDQKKTMIRYYGEAVHVGV